MVAARRRPSSVASKSERERCRKGEDERIGEDVGTQRNSNHEDQPTNQPTNQPTSQKKKNEKHARTLKGTVASTTSTAGYPCTGAPPHACATNCRKARYAGDGGSPSAVTDSDPTASNPAFGFTGDLIVAVAVLDVDVDSSATAGPTVLAAANVPPAALDAVLECRVFGVDVPGVPSVDGIEGVDGVFGARVPFVGFRGLVGCGFEGCCRR